MTMDRRTLEMALVGFDKQIAELTESRRRTAAMLGQASIYTPAGPAAAPRRTPRKLSAGARKRIAAAQRKRWKEYRNKKGVA